jgi:hypothetical protein
VRSDVANRLLTLAMAVLAVVVIVALCGLGAGR